jgi:hypothetical protein
MKQNDLLYHLCNLLEQSCDIEVTDKVNYITKNPVETDVVYYLSKNGIIEPLTPSGLIRTRFQFTDKRPEKR